MEDNQGTNKKAFFFFLLLLAFGFVCFKYTAKDKENIVEQEVENPDSCPSTVALIKNDGNQIFYEMTATNQLQEISPSLVIESNGKVLAEQNNSITCDANNIYSADSSCTMSASGKVDYKSGTRKGTMVSKSATLEMLEIQAPIRIMSGKLTVKDSNRQLTKEDPVYKPAGEQIDDIEVSVVAPPGDLRKTVDTDILNGAVQKQAFGTEYSVGFGEQSGDPGKGNAVVNDYAPNLCETCNNKSNNNPDKSNKAAQLLKSVRYNYPNQKDAATTSSGVPISECTDMTYVDLTTSDCQVCVDNWKRFIGKITAIFSISTWDKCTVPKIDEEGNEYYEADCIDSESIFVKMSPIFEETNAYMETRNKNMMSPEQASEYKNKYVTTPCVALIDGKQEVPVKCAWDMSYLFHERKMAEFNDVGGSVTPSEGAYETYIQTESATREDPLVPL